MKQFRNWVWSGLIVTLVGCGSPSNGDGKGKDALSIPVEVGPVTMEPLELRRTFSGTLESPSSFEIAAKVGGRLERLAVGLADQLVNGQIVAELDDAEYEQESVQAQAELAVASANLVEARSKLVIAQRDMDRVSSLEKRGIATESQVDAARAEILTREAAVEVAKARVTRANAFKAGAEIRLGYTKVTATWSGGGRRFVSRRHVTEGDTIGANTPIITIVELDPILAAIYVTEKHYGLLHSGQEAIIRTDAFPNRLFEGRVSRVAPAFNRDSRQARVELQISNEGDLLKPGMFVQAEIILDRIAEATTVPLSAVTNRDTRSGVYVVSEGQAHWREVVIGLIQGDRVQVEGTKIRGEVVTLGQHLIEDGSTIHVPQRDPAQP